MDEALELARQGLGRTSPNPTVGAVLVNGGEIVGRGFHTYAGLRHAEVVELAAQGPARLLQLEVQIATLAAAFQVPLDLGCGECIDFAIEVGLHTQLFRAQHEVFLAFVPSTAP